MIPEWLENGAQTFQRMAGDIFRTNPKDPAVRDREKQIKQVMGVEPNILDPQKSTTPVSVITDYQPGKRPYLEAHEAGHLSFEDAGPAKLLGLSGRTVQGISEQLGRPAPLEIASGLLHKFDAAEEDRAERLSAKYGPQLGGKPENAPIIHEDGTSNYGRQLRRTGDHMIEKALAPVVDPIKGAISAVDNEFTRRKQAKLQPQITPLVNEYRHLMRQEGYDFSELQKINKQIHHLRDQYGEDDFFDFVSTIK